MAQVIESLPFTRPLLVSLKPLDNLAQSCVCDFTVSKVAISKHFSVVVALLLAQMLHLVNRETFTQRIKKRLTLFELYHLILTQAYFKFLFHHLIGFLYQYYCSL